MTKTFAAISAAFALSFATLAYAATAPAKPIVLPAKPGNVTFDHSKHVSQPGVKCTTCHATEAGGAIDGFGKTVDKTKAHAKCWECHKTEGKGPQKCADCHTKA